MGAAFGAVATVLSSGCGEQRLTRRVPSRSPGSGTHEYLRGINSYTLNYASRCEPRSSYRYLAARGHRIIRLPFQWGSVQARLGGPLDEPFLRLLTAEVAAIGRAGMRAILDVHSGGRHPDVVKPTSRLGNGISQEQFNDLWLRLSDVFRDDRRVYAYDLMNEPYELADDVWQSYSQGVVQALRAHGDRTLLWIEGNDYASRRGVAGASAPAVDRRPDRPPRLLGPLLSGDDLRGAAAGAHRRRPGRVPARPAPLRRLAGRVRPARLDRRGRLAVGAPRRRDRRAGVEPAGRRVVRDGRRGAAGRHLLRRELGVRQLAVGVQRVPQRPAPPGPAPGGVPGGGDRGPSVQPVRAALRRTRRRGQSVLARNAKSAVREAMSTFRTPGGTTLRVGGCSMVSKPKSAEMHPGPGFRIRLDVERPDPGRRRGARSVPDAEHLRSHRTASTRCARPSSR